MQPAHPEIAKALAEQLPPLPANAAAVEADRCLYCYDAPCTHACPTHIDIPRFIKKIASGNLRGSAETIYSANLLGATCARVCPVQELCEGACVLGSDHKPIAIGRLQRHAMDYARAHNVHPVVKAAPTGQSIAVIGAGPAGLSCAGELAKRGHAVTIFEKRSLAGGLSTYGIIALREPVEIALEETRMIESLGVTIKTGIEEPNTPRMISARTNDGIERMTSTRRESSMSTQAPITAAVKPKVMPIKKDKAVVAAAMPIVVRAP